MDAAKLAMRIRRALRQRAAGLNRPLREQDYVAMSPAARRALWALVLAGPDDRPELPTEYSSEADLRVMNVRTIEEPQLDQEFEVRTPLLVSELSGLITKTLQAMPRMRMPA